MSSLQAKFKAQLDDQFAAQPPGEAAPLLEADLAHLPPPVQRYLHRTRAVGRPRPRNFRIAFDARMWRSPGSAPMPATSVQYNFLAEPARLFFMRARMFGLPVRVLHLYAREQATMRVRVAGLVNMVDLAGDVLSVGETVTLLNDLAFFAPGGLVDRRLTWGPHSPRSAQVSFANGRRRVGATLLFNERDELVDFTSDDRPALQPDGTLGHFRWSTPVEGYREVGGRWLPTGGAGVYRYPEGDFTYGRFSLTSIAYDLAGP
jgi:hypothetical protein